MQAQMRVAAATAAAMMIAGIGAAQAADWPAFRNDQARSGYTQELRQPPLSVRWTFVAQGPVVSSVSISQGIAVVGSRDNNVYALNAADGSLRWKFLTGGWVDSSPAISADAVYVASRDGHMYCLNLSDGALRWKYQSGGTDCASPLVSNGRLIAGTGFPEKFIYCLDAATGKELWRQETQQMVYSSAALQKDTAIIGANDGYLYCLDAVKGKALWKYHTGGGIYFAAPCLGKDRVFCAPGNSSWNVYALSRQTGALLWSAEIPDRQRTPNYVSSMALSDEELLLTGGYEQQYLYCFNPATGALRWKTPLSAALRHGFSSSPCLTEDIVYAASGEGTLHAIERVTGRLVWTKVLGNGILASPSVSNGVLYLGTMDGTIYALE